MTVYVDDLFEWPANDWRKGKWCHMWTDSHEEELHALALSIGLKRAWFQVGNIRFHHYDLRPAMRNKALQAGAQYLPLRDWIRRQVAPPPE